MNEAWKSSMYFAANLGIKVMLSGVSLIPGKLTVNITDDGWI